MTYPADHPSSVFQRRYPICHLGIDGGTSTVGVCRFQPTEKGIRVLETRLLDAAKIACQDEHIRVRLGELSARLHRLRLGLVSMMEQENPERLISPLFYESHFLNPRRPNSVIPLVRFQQIVLDLCHTQGLSMETVAPQQMKRAIEVQGKLSKADKDKVYLAIKRLVMDGKIQLDESVKLDILSEHEIDAIGISYTGRLLHYPTHP